MFCNFLASLNSWQLARVSRTLIHLTEVMAHAMWPPERRRLKRLDDTGFVGGVVQPLIDSERTKDPFHFCALSFLSGSNE